MAASAPFLFVPADPMQEIEDWKLFVGGIPGRRIHEGLAFVADGFGVVLDHLDFAMRDSFPRFVEAIRRSCEGGFIIRPKHDRPAKTTAPARSLARCRCRLGGAFAFCHDLLFRESSDLPCELHLVIRGCPTVRDANVVTWKLSISTKEIL